MINIVKSDIFEYIKSNNKYKHNICLIHVCNNLGGWGRGFVVELSEHYNEPEKYYRENSKELGSVHFVQTNDIIVANMICQQGYKSIENKTPLQYHHLKTCLTTIKQVLDSGLFNKVVAPKFGCGLAGGNFEIICDILLEVNLPITICVK